MYFIGTEYCRHDEILSGHYMFLLITTIASSCNKLRYYYFQRNCCSSIVVICKSIQCTRHTYMYENKKGRTCSSSNSLLWNNIFFSLCVFPFFPRLIHIHYLYITREMHTFFFSRNETFKKYPIPTYFSLNKTAAGYSLFYVSEVLPHQKFTCCTIAFEVGLFAEALEPSIPRPSFI